MKHVKAFSSHCWFVCVISCVREIVCFLSPGWGYLSPSSLALTPLGESHRIVGYILWRVYHEAWKGKWRKIVLGSQHLIWLWMLREDSTWKPDLRPSRIARRAHRTGQERDVWFHVIASPLQGMVESAGPRWNRPVAFRSARPQLLAGVPTSWLSPGPVCLWSCCWDHLAGRSPRPKFGALSSHSNSQCWLPMSHAIHVIFSGPFVTGGLCIWEPL